MVGDADAFRRVQDGTVTGDAAADIHLRIVVVAYCARLAAGDTDEAGLQELLTEVANAKAKAPSLTAKPAAPAHSGRSVPNGPIASSPD